MSILEFSLLVWLGSFIAGLVVALKMVYNNLVGVL